MATSPNRIAWDSCAWIAHIQKERILGSDGKTVVEERAAMCRAVLQAAENGSLEIVVSSLCLVEVLAKDKAAGIDDQKVRDFFDNDYILLVSLDKHVGDYARKLMLAGYPRIKPPDAIHIATAAITNAETLHTFDDDILPLDNMIDRADGMKLRIKKPEVPASPAPLLDAIHDKSPKA